MLEVSQFLISNNTTEPQQQQPPPAFCWNKNRHEDQWIGIQDPDINPCSYSQLTPTKEPKHTMEKRQPLQQMLLRKLDIHM
jgi:hypothetical protein